jgi:tRNA(fMet)-specific endonuclease VapC
LASSGRYWRLRKLIGPLDPQMAAIALVRGMILVTYNTAEFARIPELKLEDWQS